MVRLKQRGGNIMMENGNIVRTKQIGAPSKINGQQKSKRNLNTVVASMSLDEMLEASSAATICLRGGEIPVIESDNVKIYVDHVSRLRKKPETRKKAEALVNMLNRRIVKKNIETSKVNQIKARRSYSKLISDK